MQRRLARYDGGVAGSEHSECNSQHASEAIRLIGSARDLRKPQSLNPLGGRLTADLVEFHSCSGPTDDAFFAALLRDARHQSVSLRSQIRSAAWAASGNKTVVSGSGTEGSDEPWRLRLQSYSARLIANLSFDSTVFSHAVRMAVCLPLATPSGAVSGLQRTYWIPMTIAIVLKPDFTSTFARGVLRIGGTMAGLVSSHAAFPFFMPVSRPILP